MNDSLEEKRIHSVSTVDSNTLSKVSHTKFAIIKNRKFFQS